ncbi:hypothetical protein [Alloactinosynnema sp. L-07]|uniref:hypothetical protein n=1 Tax=Alloactinosynnema sp. L-07 TaxID=1653480 RepID=UPI00065EF0BA|nr:hypothetical protein [Alloactinosynnema sp. L-07]CRK58545.1 hypothetical protein [Alloactinosynnema sp. L-07]
MSAPQRPGQQPGQYRPDETEWISRVTDGPRFDEPFRFVEEPPAEPTSPAMTWFMRILGLVAVAVLSGAVYWYVNDKPAGQGAAGSTESAKPTPDGVYQFEPHSQVRTPKVDSDCASHAYDDTKQFLAQPGVCEKVTQALYTAKVGDRDALVSVSVVHLSSAEKAAELRKLTDSNGTGNVNDLVREKVVKIDGVSNLSNGYASKEEGEIVTIVEADFTPKGTKDDKKVLDKVCDDALRLGKKIDEGS